MGEGDGDLIHNSLDLVGNRQANRSNEPGGEPQELTAAIAYVTTVSDARA